MIDTLTRAMRMIGRRRRRRFYLVWLLAILVTALEAVSAVLVLVLMRLVLEPGEIPEVPVIGDPSRWLPGSSYREVVLSFAVAFAVFFVIRGVAFLLQRYAMVRVAENTGVLVADRLVQAYLSMPYAFHLRRNSAELIRNAYDNVQEFVSQVLKPIAVLVAESVLVVVMLGVLLVASPIATIAASVLMGLIVLGSFAFVQPRLEALGRQRQHAAKSAIQHLQQALGGVRDIKILHRERYFSRRFQSARRRMARAQYGREVLKYVPRVAIETAFLLFVLAVLSVSVLRGTVSTVLPVLGLFAYAGLLLQPSLQKIAAALNDLRYAEVVIEDLRDDLELAKTELAAAARGPEPEPLPFEHEIRFENVSFRYAPDAAPALAAVDTTIPKGGTVGIAGVTGGGKTTFLDLLCGLLTPTDGRLTIDGVDVASSPRAWQRNIGVVHQSSFLIDDTIRANVAFGVPDDEIDDDLVRHVMAMTELEDVVAELPDGLDTILGERGVRFSGGQRQRVALARALYHQPALLILDEGTSALDNVTEARVIENLEQLRGDTTLVMVAHRLTTIMRCDTILFLEHGHLRAEGTYEQLKEQDPAFRTMAI